MAIELTDLGRKVLGGANVKRTVTTTEKPGKSKAMSAKAWGKRQKRKRLQKKSRRRNRHQRRGQRR